MQLPLQIHFHDIDHSDAIEAHVRRRAAKLDRFFDRITSCRVGVEMPHRHHRYGKRYRVSIALTIPGHEIAVARDPPENIHHEDLHATIDDAFDDAERVLQDHVALLRREEKTRSGYMHGRIAKLFRNEGYGFIAPDFGTATEGTATEVYFHENSVLHHRFEKLEVGDEVRYAEEDGEKGPQASTVIANPRRGRSTPARV